MNSVVIKMHLKCFFLLNIYFFFLFPQLITVNVLALFNPNFLRHIYWKLQNIMQEKICAV